MASFASYTAALSFVLAALITTSHAQVGDKKTLASPDTNTDGNASAAPVTYFESAKVSAAFARGMPLIEVANYKVHASRREGPGMAEVHVRDTDTIYVLEGSATFITGGTMIDGKTVAPDEIRGAAIRGGESRRIGKGDVIVVPNGTPHWFQEVQGPLTYYVVKVTSTGGVIK